MILTYFSKKSKTNTLIKKLISNTKYKSLIKNPNKIPLISKSIQNLPIHKYYSQKYPIQILPLKQNYTQKNPYLKSFLHFIFKKWTNLAEIVQVQEVLTCETGVSKTFLPSPVLSPSNNTYNNLSETTLTTSKDFANLLLK